MGRPVIGPAVPDDAPALARVLLEAWLETYPRPEAGIDEAWIREQRGGAVTAEGVAQWRAFLVEAGRGRTFCRVVRTGAGPGGIAGFACARRDGDGASLGPMYLLRRVQGRGLGGRLMRELLAWAGEAPVRLWATEYNAGAVRFYERHGFVRTGERELWRGRLPNIRMVRPAPALGPMDWINHGERTVYRGEPWLTVRRAEVELPDGTRLDHHVVRTRPVAFCAAVNAEDAVLLIHRHRFIPDTHGWELPGGGVDEGEDAAAAAARELLEETGHRAAAPLRPLAVLEPDNGLSDTVHHVYRCDAAEYVGEPEDAAEADRVEWVPLARVPALLAAGELRDSTSAAALLALLAERRGGGGAEPPMRQVAEFRARFNPGVDMAAPERLRLRARLLREEAEEAAEALERLAGEGSPAARRAVAHELADTAYLAYGAAEMLGIDLPGALGEVHRANMTKLGRDGRPVRRADGKVVKGPDYRPPNLDGFV